MFYFNRFLLSEFLTYLKRVFARIWFLPRLPFKRPLLSFPTWLSFILNPSNSLVNDIPGYIDTEEYNRIRARYRNILNNRLYIRRDNTALIWRAENMQGRTWIETSLDRHGLTNPDQIILFYRLTALNNTNPLFLREFAW